MSKRLNKLIYKNAFSAAKHWLLVPMLGLLISCGNSATDGSTALVLSGKAFTGSGIVNTDALVTDDNGNLVYSPDPLAINLSTGGTSTPCDLTVNSASTQDKFKVACEGKTGIPGATVTSTLRCETTVGVLCSGKISISSNDPRNLMTGFILTNPTTGGAVPTINLAGSVNWIPNTLDAQTRYLTLTITQQTEQYPISWRGKLKIISQLDRRNHETHSQTDIYS